MVTEHPITLIVTDDDQYVMAQLKSERADLALFVPEGRGFSAENVFCRSDEHARILSDRSGFRYCLRAAGNIHIFSTDIAEKLAIGELETLFGHLGITYEFRYEGIPDSDDDDFVGYVGGI